MPHSRRRKSSSRSRRPLTFAAGALRIARTASENIVYLKLLSQASGGRKGGKRKGGYRFAEVAFGCWVFSDHVSCCGGLDGLYPRLAIDQRLEVQAKKEGHTTAGHTLVIAISFLPCLSKSIARPFVSTLIPTLPTQSHPYQPPTHHLKQRERRGEQTHSIRGLPPKKSRINRRRNNHYPPLPPIPLKLWQRSMHTRIQTLRINPLHQLKPLHRRILN